MKVEQCMTRQPRTCSDNESLESAARIMWESDCGCVPIVDGSSRLVGMITDRDICMAAYTQGTALHAIPLSSAMARQVTSCGPKDSLDIAERLMGLHQIRRLPVVDSEGRVVGVLSISDLARRSTMPGAPKSRSVSGTGVLRALATISAPHAVRVGDRVLASQPSLNPGRKAKPIAKATTTKARASKSKVARRSR